MKKTCINSVDGYLHRQHDECDPQSFMEEVLIERIAVCCLMLYRAAKAEREYMLTRLKPPVSDRLSFFDYDDESYKRVMKHDDIEHLTNIYLRYQTTIENRLYKAMHELERLQRILNLFVAREEVPSISLKPSFNEFILHPLALNGGPGWS